MMIMSSSLLLVMMMVPSSFTSSPGSSWMTGTQLRVLAVGGQPGKVEIVRNSSGFILEVKGELPELLSILTDRYNTTISYVQDHVVDPTDQASYNAKIMGYLFAGSKVADLFLLGITYFGFLPNLMDCTRPFAVEDVKVLIPYPVALNNIDAVVRPFDFEIWILTLISFVASIGLLYGFSRLAFKAWSVPEDFESARQAINYVFGVAVNQGGWCPSRSRLMAIAFLAGSWCLASFVLSTAYSSLLVSFILAPNAKPLIRSLTELAEKRDVHLTVEKGSPMDNLLHDEQYPNTKLFNDAFKAHPELRCDKLSGCLEQVRSRKVKRVFVNGLNQLNDIINKDVKETGGACRYTLAEESVSYIYLVLVLPKGSLYTAFFNDLILKLWENGLFRFWASHYYPKRSRCADYRRISSKTQRRFQDLHVISLIDISGAFVVLGSGIGLTLVVFIGERLFHHPPS